MELATLISRYEIRILLGVTDGTQRASSVREVAVDIANMNDQRITGGLFGCSGWDIHLDISCLSIPEGVSVVEIYGSVVSLDAAATTALSR